MNTGLTLLPNRNCWSDLYEELITARQMVDEALLGVFAMLLDQLSQGPNFQNFLGKSYEDFLF